jgi:hypothetical protein
MPRSIEQIEADYKGQNLRVIVREMMKANPKLIYSVNGLEFTPGKVGSHGKKPDLIRHISLWEGQGLLGKNVTEPVTVIEELEPVTTTLEPTTKPAKVTINQESEYTQSEAERLAIGEHPVLEDLPFLRKYRRKEPCAIADYEPRETRTDQSLLTRIVNAAV